MSSSTAPTTLPIISPTLLATPTTNTATSNQITRVAALLTESDTTVTAFQITSTTGLAVVDGTTLTWRGEGLTLSDGDVISAGFGGLEDRTTTALFGPVVFTSGASSSSGIYTIETINPASSATSLQGTRTTTSTSKTGAPATTSPGGGTAASASASTSSTSSTGMAPTLSAGKAAILLGAVGGFVAMAL